MICSFGDLTELSTKSWGGLTQITMQCICTAWPAKTKLRMTLDCSRIAKEIMMVSGIFVERRKQLVLQLADFKITLKILSGWSRFVWFHCY